MLLASFTIVFLFVRSASCLIIPERQGQPAYDPLDQILPASPQWQRSFPASSLPGPDALAQNASLAKRVINDTTDSDHRPGGILTYNEAVEVGDYLIQIMTAPPSCRILQSRWTDYEMPEAYGWSLHNDEMVDVGPEEDESFSQMYNDLQLSLEPKDDVKYEWVHDQESSPPGPQRRYPPTGGSYENILNPSAILAMVNFGPEYSGKNLEPPEVPVTGADLIPLRQWSDVVFLQWQEFCENDLERISMLSTIVRVGIINEATVRIAKEALRRNGKEIEDWDNGELFFINQDEAKALLATPNGQGVVWFLAQHQDQLGRQHVWGVRVFGSDPNHYEERSLNLCFHIEPVPPREDEDMGDGDGEGEDLAKRTIDYNNDDVQRGGFLDYEEAIEVGVYLTALVDAPPSCVHQSTWTDFRALDAYGWSLKHPRRVNVAELYDSSIVDMYHDLEFSAAFEDNLVINWVHSKVSPPYGKSRPNTNDQRRYPISQGRYQNLYNPQAILAKFNFSPEYKGKDQIPPVRGADLIQLRQWSDVTFLQWQDYCNDDPEQMRELRAVMRQDVINPVTKDIAFRVLAKHGKELSVWSERLELGKGTDGLRAMLATPNGQGIVWFLAQHKRQLGRLEVTGVTIFCNEILAFGTRKSLNILFSIGPKDGQADWDEDVEMGEGE
ncbi:hypothetical protein LTR37_015074 [Vermiconidia calcicola]|uniref:Uncharacterized protein n=1 Tax=Vermiconidia calcicola TaxID=1690605 RepID=A0ACC3MT27_9PEZI|nr:hypothetical protein LTR37_015074 [Vermiconidia calcicola]